MYKSKRQIFFIFLFTGILFGAGIFMYIQKANASQVGGIGVSASVPPNFAISFEDNAVIIRTNMKVMVNGKMAP
jgi:hypothetical protein